MKKVLMGIVFATLMWLACGGGVDTQAPDVLITNPNNNSMVSGTIEISVGATDNEDVEQVDLYINDTLIATFTVSPYTYSWVTDSLPNNSQHTIFARAYDAEENEGTSPTVTVTVFNDTTGVEIFLWNFDPQDVFNDPEVGGNIDCSYWIEQALLANGYTCTIDNELPASLDSYDIIFVTLGWFRC